MKLAHDLYLPPEGTENKSLSPIIFLHGRLDSKKTWKKFAPEIAKRTGREVYAIDARNHGDSPWSDEINLDVLVSDLEEFMNDLDIDKAILIGHSLGGRTSLAFALKKPEAVEKLIVEDMDTKNYDSISKRSIQQIIILLRESLKAIPPQVNETEAKKAIVAFIKEKLPPAQPQQKERGVFDLDTIPIKKEGDTYVWKANIDVLENMLMSDRANKEFSGVYSGDALFLYGTESFFNVKSDEDINKFFPRATKVPIEGAGHLIHQDYPEEFLKLITDFILK
ncbi:Protein ABHD11 [Araneus ventricosus]|uniref:sn-1-specific diacylglycerol lipase ABHD11 n=1 Tax=Araneus ventricosus TaxID=182803 RepID=A0A4Y2L202_ARAVE|nr:Protein ABHD11 [Araneus ventricosus]